MTRLLDPAIPPDTGEEPLRQCMSNLAYCAFPLLRPEGSLPGVVGRAS